VELAHGVPLAPLTTLGLGGAAKRLAKVTTVDELREALAIAARDRARVLVLGGGSNLVVGDRGFDGLVVHIAIGAHAEFELEPDHAIVRAPAGVRWDDLVAEAVELGLAGIEALSGIPGLVGATPMQNVGAYGQEVSDTITAVHALDRATGELVTIAPAACAFAYRASAFRGSDRHVITGVDFRLARSPSGDTPSSPIRYAELAKALGIASGATASLAAVRETVIALRRGKGMVVDANDPESRSAGSFFTNPIVNADVAATLPADAPRWPQLDGTVKLAAAWLIERAGFAKGTARGHVGISAKHALALVHRGGGSAGELLALAREIQAGVRRTFGVELQPEPIIVGE